MGLGSDARSWRKKSPEGRRVIPDREFEAGRGPRVVLLGALHRYDVQLLLELRRLEWGNLMSVGASPSEPGAD